MPAGTIALTNNSTTVTGSGTSFTTELKVNDFVVSTVGGVAYTLGVKSIESNTSLTLMENYTGPSASGQSWTPVPYSTMAAITAQLAAQVTYAIRGLNLDKANWQQVFTAPGNITVSLPDGTSWQGPSWAYMATQFSGKANTSDVLTKADNLNSLTDKATARTNLGLKGAAVLDVGTASGTVAAGNDIRIDGALQKTGGNMTGGITSDVKAAGYFKTNNGWVTESGSSNGSNILSRVYGPGTTDFFTYDFYLNSGNFWAARHIMTNAGGVNRVWEMRSDNSFRSPGTVYAAGTALTSDARLKSNFEDVHYDLDIIDGIIPQYYDKRIPDGDEVPRVGAETSGPEGSGSEVDIPPPPEYVRELGIVAQKLQKVLPGLVSSYYWNEKYPDLLSINYSGLAAWLVGYVANLKDLVKSQGETITKQDGIISKMEVRLAELESRMKAIDGLDA